MLEKPLVLDGDGSLPEVIGHLVKVHQHPVFLSVDVLQFFPIPCLLVLIVDEGALIHGVVLRPDLKRRGQRDFHILLEIVQPHACRQHADEQDGPERDKNRPENAQNPAQNRLLSPACRFLSPSSVFH